MEEGDDDPPHLLPLLQVTSSTRTWHSPSNIFPTSNTVFILLGPVLSATIWFCASDLADEGRNMLAVLGWVFSWWVTEAVPMAVTSMAPLFLFPLFGIATADAVARCYMDDVISLVLGSFILALAVQHYNIHRRLALNVSMVFCGNPPKPALLLLGVCATSAFISMWMHNTAAAVLMIPVGTGILHRFPAGPDRTPVEDMFCKAVVLAVIYAVPIGGMSTLTGTGVNLILAGMWKNYFPEGDPITFNQWLLFGFPLAFCILVALWVILCTLYVSTHSSRTLSCYLDRNHLRRELDLLGPMGFAEKSVLTVFSVLIVLWMTRSISEDIPGWGTFFNNRVGDGTVSVMMATLLFVIPNHKGDGQKLMDWKKCDKLPWNIVLLLGAGLAIADGVRTSGLANILSQAIDFLQLVPKWAMTPSVCVVSAVLTELITSNNAATLLLTPLLIQIAIPMRVHPLLLMVPGAIGAQFAFMLPTATPSNTLGFATGYVEMIDFFKTGLLLKIVAIVVVSILMPTLGVYVFGTSG